MLKRLIAAISVLAFALAFLPAGIGWCSAQPLPCCAGKMCPMLHHHAAAKHSDCGMSGMDSAATDSAPTMCSCTSNLESRYVAALVFVLSAPPTAAAAPIASPTPAAVPSNELIAFSEIVPPPPRPALA